MMMGVLGCAALSVPATWLIFLVIFVFAKVGFAGSLIFYDSMCSSDCCDVCHWISDICVTRQNRENVIFCRYLSMTFDPCAIDFAQGFYYNKIHEKICKILDMYDGRNHAFCDVSRRWRQQK